MSRKIVSRPPPTAVSPIVQDAPSRVGIAVGQDNAQGIRSLSRLVVPGGNDGKGFLPQSGVPSRFIPPSQSARPRGLLTGEPMPQWPVPPPIWDFRDRFGDDSELPKLNGLSIPMLDQYIRYLKG